MQLEADESSAVIVLEKEESFKLYVPGTMGYDEAPANIKTAVVLCSLLFYQDKAFSALLSLKGREYYEKYFSEAKNEK